MGGSPGWMRLAQSRYHEVYARALRDPQGFWAEAAQEIDWYEPAKQVFDGGAGIYGRWFVGASCNTCYNAIDRHVAEGRANQTALIYDSPVTNTIRTYTYNDALAEIATLAAVLEDFGVGTQGDRVILYMPMVPEAVIAMLACARIGAVHSVVFGGFAARGARQPASTTASRSLILSGKLRRRADAQRCLTSRCSIRPSIFQNTSPKPA